jgi:hypothetical protein
MVLKVVEEKAGKVVVCLRCEERVVAPARASPLARATGDVGSSRQEAQLSAGPPGLFAGMSRGTRCAVAVLVGIGTFNLLLPLLSPRLLSGASVPGTTAPWAVVLALCSLVLVLVILHGQATACPRCRKWWARTKVVSEFVDREVFDKDGVPFAKSVYRITYQCAVCQHPWSVMQADEYREPNQRWQKRHGA